MRERALMKLAELSAGDPEQPLPLEELARALNTTPELLLPVLRYLQRRDWVTVHTHEGRTSVWVKYAGLDEADRLALPRLLRWWHDPAMRVGVVCAVVAGVVATLCTALASWLVK
jgi:hypothetical protein